MYEIVLTRLITTKSTLLLLYEILIEPNKLGIYYYQSFIFKTESLLDVITH